MYFEFFVDFFFVQVNKELEIVGGAHDELSFFVESIGWFLDDGGEGELHAEGGVVLIDD